MVHSLQAVSCKRVLNQSFSHGSVYALYNPHNSILSRIRFWVNLISRFGYKRSFNEISASGCKTVAVFYAPRNISSLVRALLSSQAEDALDALAVCFYSTTC